MDIKVEGIQNITLDMILEAKQQHKVYKLVASAERKTYRSYELSVRPTLLDENSFLAHCVGWETAVEMARY